MTPVALPAATSPARPLRLSRLPLAAKLAFGFVGLVALVLIVNGAIDAALSYSQAKRAALEVEAEKARAAAERVGVFLDEIQTELGWTAGVEWGYAKPEQQRYDFIRLLRQAPAITALSFIDGKGREQLAVSRLEPDAVGSGKDFSADPRFISAVADKVWFGPVEFRRGSEPYMTIALAHVGKAPGVTVADVNLKLVWDVVSAIRVGDKGFAYVVDNRGRLIAHPDLSLVLRDTDFSHLPQVAAALGGTGTGVAEVARSADGAAVLTAYAVAPKTHWAVFVEQPLAEALATAYRSALRSLALLGLGLMLAAVSGVALARRMAAPIRLLQAGAEKLGGGDLTQRLDIRTGDEIEALAGGFNRMAERLQESYENLEGKVEARTRDLNEALERQTATAEILKVIASSPDDVQPVFEAVAERAMRLLSAWSVVVYRYDGEMLHLGAARGGLPDSEALLRSKYPRRPEGESVYGRCVAQKAPVAVADELADSDPSSREYALKRGFRSHLTAPMLAQGEVIGLISATRQTAGAFSDEDARLLTSFADQAAIAIRNVALFSETQASLAQQTATADVLKVISRSTFDLDAIFQTLVTTAVDLCKASSGTLCVRDGDIFRYRGMAGPESTPDLRHYLESHPLAAPTRGTAAGRAILSRQIEEIPDVYLEEGYSVPFAASGSPARSLLAVPLIGNNDVQGAIVVARAEPGVFPPRHIEILRTFADQAVIAIENARLFDEVQARTKDLQESLQQQTATADVLKVISRSAFNLQKVLDTLVASAATLCEAEKACIFQRRGELYHWESNFGFSDELVAYAHSHPFGVGGGSTTSRVVRDRVPVHIPDVLADPDYQASEYQRLGDYRTMLGVPLLRDGEPVGVFIMTRRNVRPFNARQIELLQTFSDQAVIAIENSRLFEQVQARTRELEQSLADLRKAQDRLVQSEKLASLGQLTAGIAHEIKNPLNFVNNFAALSRELLEELREPLQRLPDDAKAEADDLMGMIDSNLEKVASHGKRADSIVKNMLLHSREGSGERARVNINAMVEEALNLGYHGARAEKPGFNVTLEKDLDSRAGEADIYLQEVTRVLLNLISNGFYASAQRKLREGPGYAPTLKVATRDLGRSVEIRIRDNGTGIPDEVRAKVFNPFFTTKPAGEGTGLGLSLSHDIVVKQHGGTLDVETAPGAFTEFVITLPREGAGA